MSGLIISVSGLRGVIGGELNPEIAARYVRAFAAELPPGRIVLSRDGRTTGPLLADAVRAALCGVGRPVSDAGVAATPTLGVLVRDLGAAGGIQISASHNPPEYNGIKLFAADGRVLPAAAGAAVKQRYASSADALSPWVDYHAVGRVEPVADPHAAHLELVLATVDAARIRQRKFRVLLDSNHGAGGLLGQRLLEELGCQVTLLGGEPDGCFAHPAEPTAENLAGVLDQVIRAGADVGFCQDPDADRLAVIDQHGRYVGEEYTLALCLNHVLAQRPGPIVTNCATSRMSEDLAQRHGCPFFRSAVGEANVVDAMNREQAVFGGEGNGGPIDPRVGMVRDSFVGMAQILDALAARERTVAELVDELPRYEIHKAKTPLGQTSLDAALDAVEARFPGAAVSRQDGLRLDWERRWLLVRGSNTEPIVRAIAEAETADAAQQLAAAALEVIENAR